MSPIEVFDNVLGRLDSRSITVDKQGRIYLNRDTQRLLGIEKQSARLYVGYDPVNKRIGLAKSEVVRIPNVGTYTFAGERPYASCREFCKKYKIYPKEGSDRYVYVGREGDWYTFQLEGYQAPDDRYKRNTEK